MLNRSKLLSLFCLLFIVNSVVADPPIAPEANRSVLRILPAAEEKPEKEKDIVRPVAAAEGKEKDKVRPVAAAEGIDWRLEGTNPPPAQAFRSVPSPINAPESVRAGPPTPSMTPTPAASAPAMTTGPVQTTAPCQNCGNGGNYGYDGRRHCYFHYWPYGTEPFGMCVCGAMRAQITNGLAAQLVFYRYDFNNVASEGGTKPLAAANLNPRGWMQLVKVAEILNRLSSPPVVIESSNDTQLDEARRQAVIAGLAQVMGSPVPPEWVVVDEPMANPLNGEEAVIVHENLLRQTEAKGLYDANDRSSAQGNGQGGGITGAPTNINR